MRISIIIPTYNEAENIPIIIGDIEKTIFKKYVGEIIIVDDSSPDGTGDIAKRLNKKYKNIIVINKEKREGIGAALRVGYNNANGDILISTDADLSFDISNIKRLIAKINEGYDLVIGSRYIDKGYYEKLSLKTFLKSIISKYGNKIARFVSGLNLHDYSANFRAIKKEVWKNIKTQDNTNSILLEMIIKSKYEGYKVCEIGVVFKDRIYGKSKINLLKETPKFFCKLIYYSLKYKLKSTAIFDKTS